jgi:hypothetical protein
LGIIIFPRSYWYNHDINRRGRRVNKPWIEKTSTGKTVKLDPKSLGSNIEVMRF